MCFAFHHDEWLAMLLLSLLSYLPPPYLSHSNRPAIEGTEGQAAEEQEHSYYDYCKRQLCQLPRESEDKQGGGEEAVAI